MEFLGETRFVSVPRAPRAPLALRRALAATLLLLFAQGALAAGASARRDGSAASTSAARHAVNTTAVSRAGRGDARLRALLRRAHEDTRISLARSSTTPYWACPESLCEAIVDPRALRSSRGGRLRFAMPDSGALFEGGGEEGGIDPQELRSAYDIPASGGEGQTIALIEEAGYKEAEADLAKYRARYGLSPCTKKNGCFRHITAQGGKPRNRLYSVGWETETALDLDMVSAACPECHILLVDEAASLAELGEAVDTAVAQGATEVSNSYGLPEQGCETECEAAFGDYDHRGVPIMVSAGDSGYDNGYENASSPNFPAALPTVIAVGGTSLKKAPNERGWNEEVWGEPGRGVGTGSGCASAKVGPKPNWQNDTGCTGRSDNDVSAVGACSTPVSTYASVEGGWRLVCGTSASSPLLAGIEAHADAFSRSLPGADAYYHDPAALFDVTSGANGLCSSPPGHEYLCNAAIGWDGPSGNGTPDGPLELTGTPPNAHTEPAGPVGATSATLNGKVEASGLATTYRFEYGTSTAYGSSAPAPEGSAGSGTTAQPVSYTLDELQADTVYHFRLVAHNSEGTSYGADQEFDTAAPVVTGVTPSAGGRAGYRPVQITGANFVHVTGVSFGSAAASFTVDSPTSITANVPVGEAEGALNVTVATPTAQSAVSPADEYTYTLGGMLGWGEDEGRLGRGFEGPSTDVPVEVSGELPEVKQLAANSYGSAALLADGEVMTWGGGRYGEIGDGYFGPQDTPVKVCAVGVSECPDGPYLQDVTQLVDGSNHTLALLADGTVVGWGHDKQGQLGGGAPVSPVAGIAVPVAVCTTVEEPCSSENTLKEVTQIAAGDETSYALTAGGTVEAWGANGLEGALGDGKAVFEEFSPTPVSVTGLSGIASVAADAHGGLALLSNGTVEAWGSNEYGTLGNGSTAEESDIPVAVCSGAGKKKCTGALSEVEAVYGSPATSYAVLKDGSVMAWGSDLSDSLGDPGHPPGPETCKVGVEREKEPCSKTPVQVDIAEVSRLATGESNADVLALLKNGELRAWGSGAGGDLGDASNASTATPVDICGAYSASCPTHLGGEVIAMAAGGDHDLLYDRH